MEQADGDMPEMTPAQRKLFELRMKVNAGRKANKQVGDSAVSEVLGYAVLGLLRHTLGTKHRTL